MSILDDLFGRGGGGLPSPPPPRPQPPNIIKLQPLISTGCITVAELKRHIANWPEMDASGEPTEVWMQSGDMLSRPCVAVEVLNLRRTPQGEASDLFLSYE